MIRKHKSLISVTLCYLIVTALALMVSPHAKAEPTPVQVGAATMTAVGVNVPRGANELVVYTRVGAQTSTPTNQWGAEVVVVNNVVTAISDRQNTGAGPTPIPQGGSVLSGHGTARVWLLASAVIGAPAIIGLAPPPPPPPPPTDKPYVATSESNHVLDGVNVARGQDQLIQYTRTGGQTVSPANPWGAEVSVVNGVAQEIRDQSVTGVVNPMPIPTNGYVLSGHGSARQWLITYIGPGDAVSLNALPPPPPSTGEVTPVPWTCTAGYVRLTIDDGPDPTYTPIFLDTLKAWNGKATFFVMGQKVKGGEALILRMKNEGHKIGNHTWSHPDLKSITHTQVTTELQRTSDAIAGVTGSRPTEWRPPYEEWNTWIKGEATRLGMTMVLWNYETDTNDWQDITPAQIAANGVTNAKNGSILLIHDIHQRSTEALPLILKGLAEKGLCLK